MRRRMVITASGMSLMLGYQAGYQQAVKDMTASCKLKKPKKKVG